MERYKNTKAHFMDCLIAAIAALKNLAVATFDRGFRLFSDVRVKID